MELEFRNGCKLFVTGRQEGIATPVIYGAIDTARFWSKVDVRRNSECWEWQGALKEGYGRFKFDGKFLKCHRVAWEMYHGETLDERHALHRCDNKKCVNPLHLYAGDQAQNTADWAYEARIADAARYIRRPGAKLDRVAVEHIKSALAAGLPLERLAQESGVTVRTIKLIQSGETWSHVKPREDRVRELSMYGVSPPTGRLGEQSEDF